MKDITRIKAQFNIPTIFTIFGSSGDLAKKKLFISLFDLYSNEMLPDRFAIVGFAHSDYDDHSFRDYVQEILVGHTEDYDHDDIEKFISSISYVQGSFTDSEAFSALSEKLIALDDAIGQCTNKLFHLAVPPRFYDDLLRNLAHSGMTIPCSDDSGWTRVLIEKPFGKDAVTAQELDALLGKLFKEEQIFRIDHYLAKETIQNILMFRFSNRIFDPVWNHEHVEKVEIKLWEDIDVADRGAFYDGIGALRDVGQNHLLQMLSLIAMEHPGEFTSKEIHKSRARVLGDLCMSDTEHLMRGQYEGYCDIQDVADDSETETYFHITAQINNDRWKDVPFILESGKALHKKLTQIVVTFREPEPCFCVGPEHTQNNKVIFDIQPEEKITVRFFAKEHGLLTNIAQKDLAFSYHADREVREIDAYEKVIYDAIIGDQVLFTNTDEVKHAWAFISSVMEKMQDVPLTTYKRGTLPQIDTK